jgi:hypothetical protein
MPRKPPHPIKCIGITIRYESANARAFLDHLDKLIEKERDERLIKSHLQMEQGAR